ncbi:MAG: PorT family protein [Bacteroidales bacterium]|nr:PorT family protein [Bacteroidales bacterium]
MAFLIPMRNLLSIKRNTFIKRFFSLLIAFLVMTISSSDIKSQDLLFGFTGGLNMNTISTKSDDGGLKVGFNLGGLAQYKLNEKMSLIANIKLSAKGQQYSKIIENQNDYLKIYHSTSLYYIDFPILFQYHIKDLLGLEIGPSFNFFLSGKDKSKIGNTTSDVRKFEKGSYNPFEFGLTFGIFTRDLGQSSFNNIFIEFRYFIGLTNVITNYGRNVNAGAFLNIGYIIENPLKK